MKFASLELRDFRNYAQLEMSFNDQVNVFVGKNGQGKSNILEALEMSVAGESFRPAQPEDFIRKESEHRHAWIRAGVHQHELSKSLEVRIHEGVKSFFINGHKTSRPELRRQFSSVTFTPDTLAVVKAGPSERRDLFDQMTFSLESEMAQVHHDFQKALKARNRLLKDHASKSYPAAEFHPVLESLTESFLPLAARVTFRRIQTIKAVSEAIQNALRSILNNTSVDISVDYVISEKSAIDWSQNQVYDALKTRLRDLRAAELSSGQSLVGPHKHDVIFYFNRQDARYFCSQGQQRAIALAVKIAHIMQHYKVRSEYPVLLLDDVFSELDREKQESLLGVLRDTPAQIFLTTTEIEESRHFGLKDTKVFTIEQGRTG